MMSEKKNETLKPPLFHIMICLIEIWEMEDKNFPMQEPKSPRLITEVENIEIEESYRKLIGTASVKFPRGTVIKKTLTEMENVKYGSEITASIEDTGVLVTTRVDSKKAEVTDFKVGSRIRIRLGYTTDPKIAALTKMDEFGKSIHNDANKLKTYRESLQTMFDGYITKCSIDTPIIIHCENLASALKKISCPDKLYKNATVNGMLSEKGAGGHNANLLKNTGIKLHPYTESCEINVGDIGLNRYLTVADILTGWSKYRVYAFLKDDKDGKPYLAVGRSYFSSPGKDSILKLDDINSKPPKIQFDYNVAQNNLTLTSTDKAFLAVEATAVDDLGKFYHITVRRNPNWDGKSESDKYDLLNETTITEKQQEMGASVLSLSKEGKKVDLSTYNIIPYMSRNMKIPHEKLAEEAKKYLESYNMNGIEGTLTLFGDLALHTGTKVELVDKRFPQKNGYYLVDEVVTTFGVDGYRQKIKLPYCISRIKSEEQ